MICFTMNPNFFFFLGGGGAIVSDFFSQKIQILNNNKKWVGGAVCGCGVYQVSTF